MLPYTAQASDIDLSIDDSMPSWSPDGKYIAFIRLDPRPLDSLPSQWTSGAFSLYVVNADGTWPRRLIASVNDESEVPSWSPDATRVAIDMGGTIGIGSVRGDRATVVPHIRWANHPAWSPISDEIAYVNERNEVWITNLGGTKKRRLSSRAGEDTFRLSWSPDGSKIVFVGTKRDGTIGLIVANTDGSGDTELFPWHDWGEDPVWSPRGDQIAFGMPTGPYSDAMLAVASLAGGVWPVGAGTLPSWAPDGRALVAQRSTKRGTELVRLNAGLSSDWTVPTGFSLNLDPAWSPDGRKIAFVGTGLCGEWGNSRRGIYSLQIGEDRARAISATRQELLEGDCQSSRGSG